MRPRHRRECCLVGEGLIFQSYEQAEARIFQKSVQNMEQTAEEGIKVIRGLYANYLQNKNRLSNSTAVGWKMEIQGPLAMGKKELLKDEPKAVEYTEPKRYFSFQKSAKNKKATQHFPQKSKKRKTATEELQESLKKLELQDKDENLDKNNPGNMDLNKMDVLNEKSIAQMLQSSNRKVIEKSMKKKLEKGLDSSFSSDSSYPMTEYSSNQSSNDNQYDEQVVTIYKNFQQAQLESFKTVSNITSTNIFSQGSKFGYNASKILYSPKKSKSKAKRVAMRGKNIPRWAQNKDKVDQKHKKQEQDPRFNPEQIYGVFLVQKLDTNFILKDNQMYARGSSARWNKHPLCQENEDE